MIHSLPSATYRPRPPHEIMSTLNITTPWRCARCSQVSGRTREAINQAREDKGSRSVTRDLPSAAFAAPSRLKNGSRPWKLISIAKRNKNTVHSISQSVIQIKGKVLSRPRYASLASGNQFGIPMTQRTVATQCYTYVVFRTNFISMDAALQRVMTPIVDDDFCGEYSAHLA